MTAVTVSEMRQVAPNAGAKKVILRTDANCATGYTVDASTAANGAFTELWSCYICDNTGAVKIATWSSLTVTVGTISTGIHTIILEGV
jgi:hypothetical protein